MLVGAIHASAGISELTGDLGMDIEALVTVGAFREELALLSGMVVLTLLIAEVAFGPMFASNLLCLTRRFCRLKLRNNRIRLLLYVFLISICDRGWIGLNRAESLESLTANFLGLFLAHILWKTIVGNVRWACLWVLRPVEVSFGMPLREGVVHALTATPLLLEAHFISWFFLELLVVRWIETLHLAVATTVIRFLLFE